MTVSARTLRAYRRTVYSVCGIEVRIGQRAAAMDALLRRHGARTGLFMTAWNPYSRKMPESWNQRMQRALKERLRRIAALPAHGQWRQWQEAHLLVPGDPRQALRLARVFRQRAVVVVRNGQAARLLMSR